LRPKNPKPQFKVRLDKLLWETFKLWNAKGAV